MESAVGGGVLAGVGLGVRAAEGLSWGVWQGEAGRLLVSARQVNGHRAVTEAGCVCLVRRGAVPGPSDGQGKDWSWGLLGTYRGQPVEVLGLWGECACVCRCVCIRTPGKI